MRITLAACGAAVVVIGAATFFSHSDGSTRTERLRALRLELASRSRGPEADAAAAPAVKGPVRAALPPAFPYARGFSVRVGQSAPQDAPTFGQPTISGIGGVGFEQDIRLDPTNGNRVYTSAPGSLSSDTSWIWRSNDNGRTFKWIQAGAPLTGKPNACAGGGDTELAVDSAGHL